MKLRRQPSCRTNAPSAKSQRKSPNCPTVTGAKFGQAMQDICTVLTDIFDKNLGAVRRREGGERSGSAGFGGGGDSFILWLRR